MIYTIPLIQQNANTYKVTGSMGISLVKQALEYKTKAKVLDTELGRDVIINVNKYMSHDYMGNTFFPAGCLNRIIDYITKKGHDFRVEYLEPYVLNKKVIPSLPGITMDGYQLKMLRRVGIYQRGVLVGPTAMGKSIILGGIVDKFHIPPSVIITPARTIFNQMYNHFCNWFGSDLVGKVGDKEIDQRHLTICLYQSISNYKVTKDLKLILMDEAHLINDTIIKFLKKCPKVFYRYAVTATPQKPENDFVKAIQQEGYIGPILCTVGDKEASKRVLPVKVKMVRYTCTKPKGKTYQTVLRQDFLFSDVRNGKLILAAKNHAIDKGMTCLILTDEIEQGKRIVEMAKVLDIDITFAHGKQNLKTIKDIIERLNERQIQTVVATKVFGTGTDIPNVDCVVLASARKSEIDTLQKIGRGRRRTKGVEYLLVIDVIDRVIHQKWNQYFYNYSLKRIKIFNDKGWEVERLFI